MHFSLYPQKKIGIMGGGQLAQMLTLEAHRLGFQTLLFSSSPLDPAAQVTAHWFQGNPENETHLLSFFNQCETVFFESEFLNFNLINKLIKTTQTTAFPSPSLMEEISDRKSQKQCLDEFEIPTSPWGNSEKLSDLFDFLKKSNSHIVLKSRKNGYDGKGVWTFTSEKDLKEFFVENEKKIIGSQQALHLEPLSAKGVHDFKTTANTYKETSSIVSSFIYEKWIDFKQEYALIIGRSQKGSFFYFPLVKTHQQNSKCLWAFGPHEHRELKALLHKFSLLLEKKQYVGVMGVELFETKEGLLKVNELAPRVHNSGHYSQNSHFWSQFALHILCAFENINQDWIIPLSKGFALYNILGKENFDLKIKRNPEVFLHWYNKDCALPGRKLGHLNTLGNSPMAALSKALNFINLGNLE